MTNTQSATTQGSAPSGPAPAERSRATSLCMIVHDELELRLRLAGLVRKAMPKLDADTVTRAGFDAISIDRIRAYCAVMLIIEFSPPDAASWSITALAKLREHLPQLPVFVFARGGNERTAARVMKMGAADYWPIHAVVVGELMSALQPVVEPVVTVLPNAAGSADARTAAADRWRQPEIAGYSLLKKIAQSPLAHVYLARNPEFTQPVALKIQTIKGGKPVSEADRARFTRECEILSKLNHRSIANVLDYGITDEYLYLALEYFPCGSLRDRLKHPISEIDAVNYAHQIGEALQIVHAAHIVHRDLKPSNLMLGNDNRLVLIDFGSARADHATGGFGGNDDCTGTPYYVCPEQTEDRECDARGDLYSLGIVLFEMLTGRLPFLGKSLPEILAAHRNNPVPRLPSAVQAYQPVIDKLLAKNPQDRYDHAAQFLDALDHVRADQNSKKLSNLTRSA